MRPFLLLALLPLAACTEARSSGGEGAPASGTGASRTYAVAGFTAVAAKGPDDVDIRVGPAFSIRAEGDPKVLDDLIIEKNGDALAVRRKSEGFRWGGHDGDGAKGRIKIFITMPSIAAADSTGSGDMTIDRVEGDGFKVGITGSGNLKVGTMKVQTADVSLTGSGDVTVAGTAKSGTFSTTGSGDVDAGGLSMSSADVSVMGSGSIKAVVNGPAKVDLMGSGDVTLTGGAKCTTSKMGPGDVSCS